MDLRSLVLQQLATPHAETRFGDPYLLSHIAQASSCRPHQVWEVLWGLVAEGLVYLDPSGQGSGTDNWHWRLSSIGAKALAGGSWEPRDSEGYLRRLKRQAPDIDLITLRYVEEALRAFNARAYLSTSVMLGVASERTVELVSRSLAQALGTRSTKLRKLLDDPRASASSRFIELRKQLEPLRPRLPEGAAETLTLDAVADLLRVARNEAGHPTGTDVDEDTAYTHLQLAARYLQRMTATSSSIARPVTQSGMIRAAPTTFRPFASWHLDIGAPTNATVLDVAISLGYPARRASPLRFPVNSVGVGGDCGSFISGANGEPVGVCL